MGYCNKITDSAVVALACGYTQLTNLSLRGCDQITDTAAMALASMNTQLTLRGCDQITDTAAMALASMNTQLTNLRGTMAFASRRQHTQLTYRNLRGCPRVEIIAKKERVLREAALIVSVEVPTGNNWSDEETDTVVDAIEQSAPSFPPVNPISIERRIVRIAILFNVTGLRAMPQQLYHASHLLH